MTCGDDLCGESLCGEDTIVFVPDADITLLAAQFFDGLTRDVPLEANGHPRTIHPVDSEVQMALMVEFGKVATAPNIGNTLRKVRSGQAPLVDSDVKNRVRTALADLVRREAITVLKVEHAQPSRHSLIVGVKYVNNETTSEEDLAFIIAAEARQ